MAAIDDAPWVHDAGFEVHYDRGLRSWLAFAAGGSRRTARSRVGEKPAADLLCRRFVGDAAQEEQPVTRRVRRSSVRNVDVCKTLRP